MRGSFARCSQLSLIAKNSEKYLNTRFSAYRRAEATMSPLIGCRFRIGEYSGRALEAIENHWKPIPRHADACWDWAEIMRRHRDPDRLDFAIWDDEERLCGLGLALTTGESVELRFLEGNPRMDCKLKGRRILIALEACANYAQGVGRKELRIQPVNSALENLYRDTYGFQRVTPPKGDVFYRKQV